MPVHQPLQSLPLNTPALRQRGKPDAVSHEPPQPPAAPTDQELSLSELQSALGRLEGHVHSLEQEVACSTREIARKDRIIAELRSKVSALQPQVPQQLATPERQLRIDRLIERAKCMRARSVAFISSTGR